MSVSKFLRTVLVTQVCTYGILNLGPSLHPNPNLWLPTADAKPCSEEVQALQGWETQGGCAELSPTLLDRQQLAAQRAQHSPSATPPCCLSALFLVGGNKNKTHNGPLVSKKAIITILVVSQVQ